MTRVLLDARVRVGGVGAYAAALEAGLESEPGVVVRVFSRGRPFRPWGRAAAAASAARWAADLVHGLHVEAPPCPQALVVTVPDLIPLDFPASMPSSLRRAVYRRLLDTTLRRAKRLITPSPATATSLVRHGADPQKVAVVPLAISPAFRPCSRELRTAARRRFAGGRPYLATAVTGRAHKNAPALAAAVARLPDVAVISTGRPIPGCGGVDFIGVLDPPTLRAFYAGAEAMLNLSHVEGFGLPAAEALACGTPVVCGPGLGALPLLRAGVVEVDVNQTRSIVDGARRLLDEPEYRRRLAADGLAATAGLTVTAMAQATLAVYRDAMEPG